MSLKATITDSEALRAITPEMMKAYLQAHGWKLDAGDLWGRWRMGAEYIFAELDIFDDRAIRAAEALQTLAQIEDRSQLDIYCELVGKPTYEELEAELARRTTGEAATPEHRCPCD